MRQQIFELLHSVTSSLQLVLQYSTCVATKLRDELQEKLPSALVNNIRQVSQTFWLKIVDSHLQQSKCWLHHT